jgi:DNA-binding IclR family transcriptional regulator
MTNKNIFRNFVNQYRKPFNTETIAELTGIEAKTVRRSIRTLLNNNDIKCISTQDKLYVSSNRYQSQVGFNQKGRWNYSTQVAEEILNILDSRKYRSIREIANAYGKSRQLVFAYLEALASIGMVGINGSGYKVLSREGILKLGTFIQPGILGKMRKESCINPKPRMRKTAA